MKFDNQLRYAVKIIGLFKGDIPLHAWLKIFFREHKQMGSKDRKTVAELVYDFYRLGHTAAGASVGDRILTGLFLCNNEANELLDYFKPEWNANISLDLKEKITLCQQSAVICRLNDIFPWQDQLSDDIDHAAFCASFLHQPDLFIRIRPKQEKTVIRKLEDRQWRHEFIPPFTVRLPNGTKVDELFDPDKEIVVQDYSSQKISEYFYPSVDPASLATAASSSKLKAWDCCAASGGKSIMLHDLHPDIDLTVSDIRGSILINLKKRFKDAGINHYKSLVADLAVDHSPFTIDHSPFDLIIADLPCTGSGTWSRNPEALYFFKETEIDRYSALQKKIISNAVPRLKKGGALIYITCSVFKKENEEVVDFIRQQFNLHLEKKQLLKGYDQKADSMFAARFIS